MSAGMAPILTDKDHQAAIEEVARLWGAKTGTPEGDRLDTLATLIDAYEAERYSMCVPDPFEALRFRMEQFGVSQDCLSDDRLLGL